MTNTQLIRPTRRHGLLRWVEAAAIGAGIASLVAYGFGGLSPDIAGLDSSGSVGMTYPQNGVAWAALVVIVCWAIAIPMLSVLSLVIGVRSGYRWMVASDGPGPNQRRESSLALAMPWLATAGLIVSTISVTGRMDNASFSLADPFRLGLTVILTAYLAAWVFGLMTGLADIEGPRWRPLIAALRLGIRKRGAALFRGALALGIACTILAFIVLHPALLTIFALIPVVEKLSIPIRRYRRNHLPTGGTAARNSPVVAPRGSAPPVPPPIPLLKGTFWQVPEPDEEFLSPTAVVGWRVWAWDGRSLRGVYETWRRASHKARCPTCREVPGWSHSCGIYAMKDPSGLLPFGYEFGIEGRVELSGVVIEHETGYRATKARIVELWVPRSPGLVEAIRARYPDVVVHCDPDNAGSRDLWPI